MLIIFGAAYHIAKNMMSTNLDAWTYASIELDKHFQERRLDYIIVREIPLGIGRKIGVGVFFLIRAMFPIHSLLTYSFFFFPFVYVIMAPYLTKIWKKERVEKAFHAA
ncbi:hypothetical protein [Aneurinibacillus terranovensis]|uniref:hypothetical protein n=1 Tax=Aneurinibacillus terranovensis TaxID=278991 RepID=UPI00040FD326|nr:hypothetical protein [Aneurinibacillus terranovensis]